MTTRNEKPRRRQIYVQLTDAEWRAVRVAAAERDTTIQAFMTNVVLRQLRQDAKKHERAASS